MATIRTSVSLSLATAGMTFVLVGCDPKPAPSKVVRIPENATRPWIQDPKDKPAGKEEGETAPRAPDLPKSKRLRPVVAHVSEPMRSTIAPSPLPGSPFSPPRLKADETTNLAYSLEGVGSIALEGVCKFTESEIGCWDANGKNSEEIKRKIVDGLKHGSSSSPLSVYFGRKNRIVVVRQTTLPGDNKPGMRSSMSLGMVGSDPMHGSGGYINYANENVMRPGEPMAMMTARVLNEEPSKTESSFWVNVSEPIPNPPEIELVKGATLNVKGVTLKITSIEKATQDHRDLGYRPEVQGWTIRISRSGKSDRPLSIYPMLKQVLYVGGGGKLLDDQAYRKWRQSQRSIDESSQFVPSAVPYSGSIPSLEMVRVWSSLMTDKEIRVSSTVDPKLLKKLSVTAFYNRNIEVKGIPLDPKP